VATALLLIAAPALSADRYDHRGALGLLIGGGFEFAELVRAGTFEERARGTAQLGISGAIGENGNELKVVVQVAGFGPPAWVVFAGYRGYFGAERFKTFMDLDLALDFHPDLVVGPRVGFGVQYELHPLLGVFAGLAVRAGIGAITRFSGEAFAGVQLRSYVLE
jgi:hypothetical protein